MPIYRFNVRFAAHDPRSAAFLADAHALGFDSLRSIECQDLYFIEGQLSPADLQQLAVRLLTDPVTQSVNWEELPTAPAVPEPDSVVVEVALRPGVTDPVAHEIVRAAHELNLMGIHRAATGSRFVLTGPTAKQAGHLATRLLANDIIQHWKLGEIEPSFPLEVASSGAVKTIPIRDLDEEGLLALAKDRRSALDRAEMQAIQAYFRSEGREPTDMEFETLAQTWSEHCVHKTFKAKIEVRYSEYDNSSAQRRGDAEARVSNIDSLIKTYLKSATEQINAPWVRSAFVDNAGILDFDGENEISFKVETHNHPSAIEPFGGANTGVGGVIRDVLGVGHKPIAGTDVLCFGPQGLDANSLPEGVLHPRRVMSGVVAGVQDYGNKIGIPTVNGAILFDEAYTANPLVFCGCVGIAPKGLQVRASGPGDRVIVLGGRTGRDGLRGATFSSMTMDAQTGEVAGASVQIGDPITEKGLIDVIVRARDLGLYHAITDCGAGGFSSAVGEMASRIGAEVELQNVRLKYPGLAPWEIWLSEAQERMVLAVPPENVAGLQALCDTFDTELTDIGEFSGSGRLVVRYSQKIVLDLDNEFLHEGLPQRQLRAMILGSEQDKSTPADEGLGDVSTFLPETLLALLSHPNIASKAPVIRIYDHEVQGGTVIKPLAGALADAPSDAAVIRPIGTKNSKGIVLSNGINVEYGKRDAYRMAMAVVDEALRNAVAVGADPGRIAILDNFCWGDPLRPETLGMLVEAARGCHDAAMLFGTPFISGKDSLNNEYTGGDGHRHAIPPTLLISAIGILDDLEEAVTMDLKAAGDAVYLVGDFAPALGGSHFSLVTRRSLADPVPAPSQISPRVYRSLHEAIRRRLVRSAHDLSEGGLAVAAAEMCIGGRLGLHLDLDTEHTVRALFGETTGCLLVEMAPEDSANLEALFADLPNRRVGSVTSEGKFAISNRGQPLFSLPLDDLVQAWNTPLQ